MARIALVLSTSCISCAALQNGAQHVTMNKTTSGDASLPSVIEGVFGLFGMGKQDTKATEYNDIFMRYMPKRNVVVCGCASCGTNSLYEYIYRTEFHKNFSETFSNTAPLVHEVSSPRWHSKFWMISDEAKKAEVMKDAFSFAVIRDPRERLISAWKAKIACGCGEEPCDAETEKARPKMVEALLDLSESDKSASENDGQCMNFEQFLHAVSKIHKAGKANRLDSHFLPMGMGCFAEYPPSNWSKIVTLKRPGALNTLAKQLGATHAIAPLSHVSKRKVLLSAEAVALMDEITEPDYELLGEYLAKEKSYLVEPSEPLKPGVRV